MPSKVYLSIFILCAVFSQKIVGTFLEDDIGEPLNVLAREKRVISRDPDEDVPVAKGAYPYIVNIKSNKRIVGVGSILSPRTAITASRVVFLDVSQYIVTTGSIYSHIGDIHNVTNKEVHMSQPLRRESGVALIYVNPPFKYGHIGSINLHSGPILPSMHGTVIGWGNSLFGGRQQTRYPTRLRAITVPIINHRICVNAYKDIFNVRDDNVCTYHEQKQCGYNDVGAPLVVDGELAGVHIGIIVTPNSIVFKPDIFILLQHLDFNQWIRSHIIH